MIEPPGEDIEMDPELALEIADRIRELVESIPYNEGRTVTITREPLTSSTITRPMAIFDGSEPSSIQCPDCYADIPWEGEPIYACGDRPNHRTP